MGKLRGDIRVIWAIFVRDLKRLAKNPVAIVIVLGICVLPSLYAWYCIAANWDPYNNTSSIKVAVANNDEGTDSDVTGRLDVGEEIVEKLRDNHELGWQFVDEKEAIDGVKSSEYYAAIVIPKGFSADFASIFTDDFTRPKIDYYVNEKLSSVAPKVTGQGATTIEKTVDKEFVSKVSETAVEIMQRFGREVVDQTDEAERMLADEVRQASSLIGETRTVIEDAIPQLESANGVASSAKGDLESLLSSIPGMTEVVDGAQDKLDALRRSVTNYASDIERAVPDDLASGSLGSLATEASDVAHDAGGEVADVAKDATDVAGDLRKDVIPQIESGIDGFSVALGSLSGTIRALGPTVTSAVGVLGELETLTGDSTGALASTAELLGEVQSSMDSTLTDLEALQNASTAKELSQFLDSSPERIGEFMASPVSLKTEVIYPVSNYGSGVAPFYSNLALWVAGFILMAVVRMRVDPEGLPPFTQRQAYFGRWLFYVVLGLVQAFIVCVGDLLIGIQCVSPVAFVGAGLLAEFVYVNLMYALAKSFRHIGKAIAVLLLIMQIPGSSGMFPVEMMPPFYQYIHPLLPFTYSIDAMREAIGGFYGLHYLKDMLLLAGIFLPIGFFIGLVIGKYAFNLNLLFDSKLGKTDLFVAEDVPDGQLSFKIRPVIAALLNTKEYREKLIAKARWFEANYLKLNRIGWVAICALPVATLAMMVAVHAGVNTKLLLLALLVCGVIAVNTYLIVISYMQANISARLASVDGHGATAAQAASSGHAPSSPASSGCPSSGRAVSNRGASGRAASDGAASGRGTRRPQAETRNTPAGRMQPVPPRWRRRR